MHPLSFSAVCLLLFASIIVLVVAENDYLFVDVNTGLNQGDCRYQSSPCRSLYYAFQQTKTGDTILLAPGTYFVERKLELDAQTRTNLTVAALDAASSPRHGDDDDSKVILMPRDELDSVLFALYGDVYPYKVRKDSLARPVLGEYHETEIVAPIELFLTVKGLNIRGFYRVIDSFDCIPHVLIDNCEMQGGVEPTLRPAIQLQLVFLGSSLTVVNSTFEHFTNGVIDVLEAVLDYQYLPQPLGVVLRGSTFRNNKSNGPAPALRFFSVGSTLVILDCIFDSNQAYAYDQRIAVTSGSGTVWFSAPNVAGKMAAFAPNIHIARSLFLNNMAGHTDSSKLLAGFIHGAALYVYAALDSGGPTGNSSIVIEDTTFKGNRAFVSGNGGAVYLNLYASSYDRSSGIIDSVVIRRCVFDSNVADQDAGGLFLWPSRPSILLLEHNAFKNNTSYYNKYGSGGGALKIYASFFNSFDALPFAVNVTIRDTTFEDNTVFLQNSYPTKMEGSGGAAYIYFISLVPMYAVIERCKFVGNSAGRFAGALSIFADNIFAKAEADIAGNLFIDNRSQLGGAACALYGGSTPDDRLVANVYGNLFDDNRVMSGACASVYLLEHATATLSPSNNFLDNYSTEPCASFSNYTCFGSVAGQPGLCGGGGNTCVDFGTCNCTLGGGHIPDCSVFCPPGYFYFPKHRSCIVCPFGSYQDKADAEACVLCPAGYYADALGSTKCNACPAGTWSSKNGSTTVNDCNTCPSGTFSNNTGASMGLSCGACPAGFWSSTASSSCSPCGYGSYSETKRVSNCTYCPIDSITLKDASSSASDCVPCPWLQTSATERNTCRLSSTGTIVVLCGVAAAIFVLISIVISLVVVILMQVNSARYSKRMELAMRDAISIQDEDNAQETEAEDVALSKYWQY